MTDEFEINLIDEDTLNIQLENEQNLEIKLENDVAEVVTDSYNKLKNKPQINSIELIGNVSLDSLGIQEAGQCPDEALTNAEIEELLDNFA